MAKGKKTGGRDFAPGNCANPLGGAAHNPAMQKLRSMTRAELADILLHVRKMTRAELKTYADDPARTIDEVEILSIIQQIIKKGDANAWNIMMNRIVGKVPEKMDLSSSDGSMTPKFMIEIKDGNQND